LKSSVPLSRLARVSSARRAAAGRAGIRFSLLWTKLIRSFDDVYGRPSARRIRSLDDSILDEGGAPKRNATTREHGSRVRGLKPEGRGFYFAPASSPDRSYPRYKHISPEFRDIAQLLLTSAGSGGLSGNANGPPCSPRTPPLLNCLQATWVAARVCPQPETFPRAFASLFSRVPLGGGRRGGQKENECALSDFLPR